jgi:hypothetical protein
MGIHMFTVSSGVLQVYEQHDGYHIRSRNCLPLGSNCDHPSVFGGFLLIFILVFCIVQGSRWRAIRAKKSPCEGWLHFIIGQSEVQVAL